MPSGLIGPTHLSPDPGGAPKPLTVALCGAGGAVGRLILSQLEADSEVGTVLGFDDLPGPSEPVQKLVLHPLREGRSLEAAFTQAHVDLAVYLSPSAAASDDRPFGWDDSEVLRAFLDACGAAKTKGVAVASGFTIYGARRENTVLLDEGTSLRPGDLPPGRVDLARERLCAAFARSCPATAVSVSRLAQVIGPGARGHMPRLLEAPRFMTVEGYDPPVQFLHTEDAAQVIFKLLKSHRSGVYNVAPDDFTSFMEIGRVFKKPLLRASPRMAQLRCWLGSFTGGVPATFLPLLMYPVLLSNRKVRRDLNYVFRFSSESALAHLAKQTAAAEPQAV